MRAEVLVPLSQTAPRHTAPVADHNLAQPDTVNEAPHGIAHVFSVMQPHTANRLVDIHESLSPMKQLWNRI